jgi:DNA-directed RNA polymerase subunit RPC12/RpoP
MKNLNNLSPKEFAKVLDDSTHLIECKCGYKNSQKKSFASEENDKKGYYIKCPKCNTKIYYQYRVYKNEKNKKEITPIIHIKTR